MFKDLRTFLAHLQELGDVETVEGAHWDLEIGTITELVAESKEHPALLFDRIQGYPPGYRVMTNVMTTVRRTALALGLPPELPPLELVRAWKEKRNRFEPIPPLEVEEAPVKENILQGQDIDLLRFPVPRWHELDPGRYLGTADAVILQDPDGHWVNVATYRMVVHDRDTLGLYISPGKHGYFFLQRAGEQKRSLPIAVSFGHDPLLATVAGIFFPQRISEYELAGGLQGRPYEVTRGPLTGLPIPAHAEMVIEGEVLPREVETRPEGPFGEFTGYYAVGPLPQPVVKVKAILFRDHPILLGMPPLKPFRPFFTAIPLMAGETWDALEKAGVPEVRGVWQFGGWYPMLTVIAIKQRYGGHAKQAGLVASGAKGSAYIGRFIVVVDEDIDITNLEDVVWALTTRCDPATDIDLIRDCWSSPIDPVLSPQMREMPHGTQTNSRMIINACRPYAWYDRFPKVNVASAELRRRVEEKFSQLLARLRQARPGRPEAPQVEVAPDREYTAGVM